MLGTYTDIQTLAKNLNALGFELDKVRDVDAVKEKQPPATVSGSSGSQEQDSMWAWMQAHPWDGAGNIQVQISPEHGGGQPSGWLDPVDVNGSGLKGYMSQHPGAKG